MQHQIKVMINPSASGWIDKFFVEQKFSNKTTYSNMDTFYQKVRNTGFIYGHIISFDTVNAIPTKGWFKEEISKVALLNTLYGVYCLENNEISDIKPLELLTKLSSLGLGGNPIAPETCPLKPESICQF